MSINNSDLTKPADFPDSYYHTILPVITGVAAEMDDLTFPHPTREMYEAMLERACRIITGDYASVETKQDMDAEETLSYGYPGAVPARSRHRRDKHRRKDKDRHSKEKKTGSLLRDLIGVLLLNELFRKRKYYGGY